MDNTGDGIHLVTSNASGGITTAITSNIIRGNGSDGIEFTAAENKHLGGAHIAGNILFSNTGHGLNFSGASSAAAVGYFIGLIDSNAFWSNTAGHRHNINAGANDNDLSADPFTNSSMGDYSINNAAGGGAILRGATSTIP